MNISVEQYVKMNYTLKGKSDYNTHQKSKMKKIEYDIKNLQKIVENRMNFSIPTYYIDSYNVDSCIVSLNNNKDMYHIIDLSMFYYIKKFNACLELYIPNMSVFTYRLLKHDLCLGNNNMNQALLYKPNILYMNTYEMEIERLAPIKFSGIQHNSYLCMVFFYFLHEYGHYLIKNPIHTTSHDIENIVVEYFLNNIKNLQLNVDEQLNSLIEKNFSEKWINDKDFREEIYCDIQSIMCLLELCGQYSKIFNAELILNSVINFLYIQRTIWQAKHTDIFLKNKYEYSIISENYFFYRPGIVSALASLLEDEEFAELLCQALRANNRFFIPTNLQVSHLDWKKQLRFLDQMSKIFEADINNIKENRDYEFPVFG